MAFCFLLFSMTTLLQLGVYLFYENEEMIVAVNAILFNCVKKHEKNSGLQRGLNP